MAFFFQTQNKSKSLLSIVTDCVWFFLLQWKILFPLWIDVLFAHSARSYFESVSNWLVRFSIFCRRSFRMIVCRLFIVSFIFIFNIKDFRNRFPILVLFERFPRQMFNSTSKLEMDINKMLHLLLPHSFCRLPSVFNASASKINSSNCGFFASNSRTTACAQHKISWEKFFKKKMSTFQKNKWNRFSVLLLFVWWWRR